MTIGPAPMIRIDLRSVRLGIRSALQLAQGLGDGQEDAVHILHDIVVPETEYSVATFCEPRVTNCVMSAVGMLAAVNLDDELHAQTSEIGNIGPNRTLLAKMKSVQLVLSQVQPEPSLCVGHVSTEPTRACEGTRLSPTSLC